ncbi:uncharacterized protein UHO2_02806 [Ustilago hordei]|uniref:uncharacterized protein n=1 Tax=Ustilago hordei TaxID=120017 RepID=UPI001A4209C2|nr:uncharacterized protein UHO2_02806 [Ustilago hordei]SYW78794.1 related to 40S ribosomal protein S27 [Ustilago hordei]
MTTATNPPSRPSFQPPSESQTPPTFIPFMLLDAACSIAIVLDESSIDQQIGDKRQRMPGFLRHPHQITSNRAVMSMIKSDCKALTHGLVATSSSRASSHRKAHSHPIDRAKTLSVDLLNPSAEQQARCHKLKRLVQNPNSFFMDVKCPGCFAITTVFSHAQTVVVCGSCAQVLSQPTGGKARLTEGCSFRKKA